MILNEYETIYIARPDLTDDLLAKINTKVQGIIADNGGTLLVAEDWGKRKLSYLIRKHTRGHYVYLNYVSGATLVAEVERNLGIEDNLLRYLTVKLGAQVDVDAAKAVAEERRRHRQERMAAQRAEEEAEARYRAEAEEAEDDAPEVEAE